jgi:hypothetical protein
MSLYTFRIRGGARICLQVGANASKDQLVTAVQRHFSGQQARGRPPSLRLLGFWMPLWIRTGFARPDIALASIDGALLCHTLEIRTLGGVATPHDL